MRIAYLVNQYPKVSHSFIRREILALELLGISILRIALRGWDDLLVDKEDESERKRTRYVLRDGAVPLFLATLNLLVTRPVKFLQTLGLIWNMSRHAERPLPVHLVYLAEACRIVLWLRDEGAEHVHAHFGTNSAEVAMLIHALGGPQWSFTVHGPEEFDKASMIGLAEKVRRCSFVVAISSFGRSQLFRLTAQEYWSKVHVIRCGLNRSFLTAPANLALSRRLVCVGRLCEQKGQLLLVEAAHQLAMEGTEFELVMAGNGDLRERIETLISRYNLGANIRITGWISSEKVQEEILAARALVLPSFAEGLPVVLMEAMALRRPVITTYVAGIPELVCSGQNGWLVPAGDLEALVTAMRTCLNASAETLARMGEAGSARVLERHDVDRQASMLGELIRNAIGPK